MTQGLSDKLSTECMQRNFALLERNFRSNEPIVQAARGVKQLAGLLEGELVVVAGAGPSLDQALPLLGARRPKIIAVDRAVRPLLSAGIVPDWIVSVEIKSGGAAKLDGLYPALKQTPIVFDPLICPETIDRYPGPLYTFDRPTEVSGKGKLRLGTGVVTFAVGLAEVMGAAPVALVGVDLAYQGDQTHSKGTRPMPGDWSKDAVEVPSAAGGMVRSDVWLACNIEELERAAADGVPLVQTTPFGAYIEGAAHAPLKEVL